MAAFSLDKSQKTRIFASMKKILGLLSLAMVACGSPKEQINTVYTSIAPLAYLVEQIADSTVRVEVLVGETTSPETFEPTSAQIQKLSSSRAYINTGLIDFETELNKSIASLSDSLQLVDLSVGVDVIAGTCSHVEHAGHAHGTDPHTWLSPRLMRSFAEQIAGMLNKLDSSKTEANNARLAQLLVKIDSLDSYIASKNLTAFAIAHPSLTYYARDYGVEQIAIEIEGKEPTIAQMKEIIDRLKSEKINKIFYQKQTSDAAARTIGGEVGAEIIEFDPLSRDWLVNMYYITDCLSR